VLPEFSSLPVPPDLVLILTTGEAADTALEQAIQSGARAVWLETAEQNTDRAWLAGMDVVEGRALSEVPEVLFRIFRKDDLRDRQAIT